MTTGIRVDKASEILPKDFERLLLRTLAAAKKATSPVTRDSREHIRSCEYILA